MANEKKTNNQVTNDKKRISLFWGDYRHDTVISECEKAAEASQVIFDKILKRPAKHAK